MKNQLTITRTATATNSIRFWVNNKAYYASRKMFQDEFNCVVSAIDKGYMVFAD